MRKIILVVVLLCGCILKSNSQTSVYVLFTSTDSEVKGVWNVEGRKTDSVLEPRQYFTLFDRANGNKEKAYFYDFMYERLSLGWSPRAFTIVKSYVDDKVVVDWDLISSKNDAEMKYKFILSHDNIYFIDKKEATDTSYKIYPVKLLTFNLY